MSTSLDTANVVKAVFFAAKRIIVERWKKLAIALLISIVIAYLGTLFTSSKQWNLYLTTVIWTAIVFIVATIYAAVMEAIESYLFFGINKGEPISIFTQSDLIVCTSVLPKFDQWFTPPLIDYLIHTAPLLNPNIAQSVLRVFVVPEEDLINIIGMEGGPKYCASVLAKFHEKVKMKAVFVRQEELEKLLRPEGECEDYRREHPEWDFSVGFTNAKNGLKDVLDGTAILNASVSPFKTKQGVTGFRYFGSNAAECIEHVRIARTILGKSATPSGNIQLRYFIDQS